MAALKASSVVDSNNQSRRLRAPRAVCRFAALATLSTLAFTPQTASAQGTWGNVATLRDDTDANPQNKPAGGWYVAPIHGVLLARSGKVVMTGTKRIAQDSCDGSTQRNFGATFVLDPAELDAAGAGATLMVQPLDEQARDNDVRHVLYCSGQMPLPDGRILYVAGTDYPRALPIISPELGLNYSRVFDPETETFTRIEADMKAGSSQNPGMKWYPTNRMLPDGRVLIASGYHWSVAGTGDKENRSVEIFDPSVWDADPNADPYTVLAQPGDISGTINQAGRAYTHVFLLPKPVPAANGRGLARSVALIGSVGDMWLLNHEPGVSAGDRLVRMPNAAQPNPSGADKGEGSTSLMLPDGTVMIMNGGRDGGGAALAYFYDPYQDEWDTLDLGIGRIFSTATWLPDGTVLLINGYTDEIGSPWALTNAPGGPDGVRRPQIIDPFTRTVTTEEPWPESTARGYHSVALLLKDGRVLIAGGKDNVHDTGCEKSEARIYTPPYLSGGPRPEITNVQEGMDIVVGGAPITIEFTGTVRAERGVALLAPGAVTHSYNQNQRYLPLEVVAGPDAGSITVKPPATLNEATPGEYLLHIVSEDGVPSVGMYVNVVPPPACVYPVNLDAGVFIEAEGSSRGAGPFLRTEEAGRGNDAFIQVDPTSSAKDVPDEGEVLWYDLEVESAGSAYLWALGNGPDNASDTLFVSVNGGPDQVVTLSPAAWGWTRVDTALDFPAGKQTLKIKAAKPGAQLDRIWLTSDDAAMPPDGLCDAAPDVPCSQGQVTDPPVPMGGAGGEAGVGGDGGAVAGGAGPGAGGDAGGANLGGEPGNVAGAGGSGTGGVTTGPDGSAGTPMDAASSDSGCGCRVIAPTQPSSRTLGLTALVFVLGAAAARRSAGRQSRKA